MPPHEEPPEVAAVLASAARLAHSQDHLTAATLYAAVATSAQPSASALAKAGVGLVEAGESLAAVPALRRCLDLGQASGPVLRGLAHGLVVAGLGSAVRKLHSETSFVPTALRKVDGADGLTQLLELAQQAPPRDYQFGRWAAKILMEQLGQYKNSPTMLSTLTNTVAARPAERPWVPAELNEALGVSEGMQSKLAGPPSLRRMLAKKHRNLEKDASRVKSVLAKVPDVLKGEAETTRRHTSPQTTAEEKKAL